MIPFLRLKRYFAFHLFQILRLKVEPGTFKGFIFKPELKRNPVIFLLVALKVLPNVEILSRTIFFSRFQVISP